MRVRLDGVDAPELCQPGGEQARQALRALVLRQAVQVRVRAYDRYHRAMVTALRSPEVRQRLEDIEFDVVASSPQEFADWIGQEIPRWGQVIQATGARVD